jgi:hypothetical protein
MHRLAAPHAPLSGRMRAPRRCTEPQIASRWGDALTRLPSLGWAPPLGLGQGPFGVGDLGPEAYAFVDWLHDAGMQARHRHTVV